MQHPADPIQAVTHPDPNPYYADLAVRRPVYRDDALGVWMACGAAAVTGVLTSGACRVRPAGEPVPRALVGTAAGEVFGRLVRMNDGDRHGSMKHAVSSSLANVVSEAAQRTAAELARGILDEMPGAAAEERIDRLAATLPAFTVAAMLGVRRDALPSVASWAGDVARCFAPAAAAETVARGSDAAAALLALFRDVLADASGERTLLAHLVASAEREGRGVDDALANAVGFLTQAYDATAGLIGSTMLALARHADVRDAVSSGTTGLRAVVDEVARFDSPVQNTRRFVAEDAVIAGQRMLAGDAILVVLAAANHDAAVNLAPERFDPARAGRRAFTFGAGVHACPGEALAKAVACAAVGALLASGADPAALPTALEYRPSISSRIPVFAASAGSRPSTHHFVEAAR